VYCGKIPLCLLSFEIIVEPLVVCYCYDILEHIFPKVRIRDSDCSILLATDMAVTHDYWNFGIPRRLLKMGFGDYMGLPPFRGLPRYLKWAQGLVEVGNGLESLVDSTGLTLLLEEFR
jgi:hypothetical protein